MKANTAALILMLFAVPVAGEINFHPFQDPFRFSLATSVFLFFLLWIQRVPPLLSGLLVGIDVVAFRIGWQFIYTGDVSFAELFQLHYPAFFYYLTYAALFQFMKLNQLPYRPLRVGVLSIVSEFIANGVELSFRQSFSLNTPELYAIGTLLLTAVIRTFFVLGFFNIIQLRQSIVNEELQRKEKERILLLVSDLYEESVQLQKTLRDSEEITRECYDLYRGLQNAGSSDEIEHFAQKALRISGQVHDIKKDNQRILAGLSKMIAEQSSADYMNPKDVGHLIVRTNEKYAAVLGKQLQINLHVEEALPPVHVYTMLSLLNNLVANAVEAIRCDGTINISVRRLNEMIEFRVSDNGPGIPLKKRKLIFAPGYTSKYDDSGQPSTGMGLYYIQEVVKSLQGQFELQDDGETGETVFMIQLPVDKIVGKG
ncbi:sensor histidine kinase [Paenibacillus beijingensis]|uniref:histidine kinase n=1 Tax=Paenibacillus beijingensis TaxID=1126833 RepID=A0A0D5NRK9_9BACL|nr:sensor histidine kinase [Paenibacillus beijingensis]AJY77969.1 histidine kinase [Paenibacillus beijingensis]